MVEVVFLAVVSLIIVFTAISMVNHTKNTRTLIKIHYGIVNYLNSDLYDPRLGGNPTIDSMNIDDAALTRFFFPVLRGDTEKINAALEYVE